MASILAQTESPEEIPASLISDSASSTSGIYTERPELELYGFIRAYRGGGRFIISGSITL
jgi:hypothetical protein